jgi:guanyl-specific ribonuclease Sa
LITEDDLVEALIDDAAVFSSLTQPESPVHRSFPVQAELTVPAMKVLSAIRRDGRVPFIYKDDGIRLCFQEGWIHVEVEEENPSSLICFLPSRLHEK